MNISCEIIRDILPLYAEGMASDPTKELVQNHLCGCENCTRELEELKKARIPVEIDTTALKRVGDSIRRRRILAVMAVFLFIATVLIGGALLLDATIYLSADEAVANVYEEDGYVKIQWTDGITATGMDSVNGNYGVIAATNLYNKWFPREGISYEDLSEELKDVMTEEEYYDQMNESSYLVEGPANFWYLDPKTGAAGTLLLDAGLEYPTAPLHSVHYYTGYLCGILLLLCLILASISLGCRKTWCKELFARLSIVCGSFGLSLIIGSAGQFADWWGAFTEHLIDSTAIMVPMTLFGLCLRQLLILNRRDKGL